MLRDGDPEAFTIDVPFEARKAMYPIVADVGDQAWFVYAPAVLPECLGASVIDIRTDRGVTRTACRNGSYVVIPRTDEPLTDTLSAKNSPIAQAIGSASASTLQSLERRLGSPSAVSRFIGVTVTPNAPSGIVAHVDRSGTVLFEVRPAFEAALNEDVLRTQVRPLLRHELFHRWNMSETAASANLPVWVYEGAAEYVGGLMSLEEKDFSPVEFNWLLGARLNRCLEAVGDGGLEKIGRGRVEDYDCGAIASWLLDLDLRRHGADHYEFWRALIGRSASTTGKGYDWPAMEAVFEASGWNAPTWRLFVFGGKVEALAEAMNAAGARVTYEGAAEDYRKALLQPLLAANCTSRSYGYFDDPSGVTLDVDTRCPTLPSQARIASVAGFDVRSASLQAYEAARNACEQQDQIEVVANDARIALKCARFEAPKASFQVLDSGVAPQ
ncbi:hypothetical protein CQ028_15090 [Brevundimonas sp. MYb33]|nr:hypothetical protein CQ028_15090 [Brevundimonas sp. MYb33]